MLKSKLRLLGVSALVGAGLIAAGPADAYNVRLGGVDVQIDTSVSLGMSYKMKDTNSHHLSLGNGGNVDNRPVVSLLGAAGAIQGGTNHPQTAWGPQGDLPRGCRLGPGVDVGTPMVPPRRESCCLSCQSIWRLSCPNIPSLFWHSSRWDHHAL